jgi:hypothetical protein
MEVEEEMEGGEKKKKKKKEPRSGSARLHLMFAIGPGQGLAR